MHMWRYKMAAISGIPQSLHTAYCPTNHDSCSVILHRLHHFLQLFSTTYDQDDARHIPTSAIEQDEINLYDIGGESFVGRLYGVR